MGNKDPDAPKGVEKSERVAIVEDDHNGIDIWVYDITTFAPLPQFAVFWRHPDQHWKHAGRSYKTVVGAIRAAYVMELKQH